MMGNIKSILALILILSLVFTSACTPSEAEQLEGILENIDTVNGEITIVTEDGETITLTIATEASVEADGEVSSLDQLEPGVSIELKVNEENQVINQITAHQTEKKWGIIQINVTDPVPPCHF